MRKNLLCLGTILGASLIASPIMPVIAADNPLIKSSSAIKMQEIQNSREAGSRFIEHINAARVAVALNNITLAQEHTNRSRALALYIQGAALEEQRIEAIEAGKVVYNSTNNYKKDHYFPIHNELVDIRTLNNGTIWESNELDITDANIVYLTLDLKDKKTESFLDNVDNALSKKDLKEADNQLVQLTDAVVMVDNRKSVSADKARDNVLLAQHFMAGKNYQGARFALKHADDALDEMASDRNYETRRSEIRSMRAEVATLQQAITNEDPTLLEQADKRISGWWNSLKSWSGTKK